MNTQLIRFIETKINQTDRKNRLKKNQFYDAYEDWCKTEKVKPLQKHACYRKLANLGYNSVKYNGYYCIKGFELIDN